MGRDLGTGSDEVHEQAAAVLAFWFDEVGPDKQFAKNEAVDRACARRFGGLRERLLASGAAGWTDAPETVLAAIVVLDQMSRNIARGQAAAFAADPLALRLSLAALDKGWDAALTPEQRVFLYMPLMHAEDVSMQERSVALFERLGREENLRFAREHRDVIARFGRFPTRNAALGRLSTPAEEAYLSQPGVGW